MPRRVTAALVLLAAAAGAAGAETFRFAYTKGERYRIVSQVRESVLVNGRFDHRADILNKIAVSVADVKDGAGWHVVTYQTSQRAWGSTAAYEWSEEYGSEFWRDARGAYTIDPGFFMPVVRDVPVFPEGDLAVGAAWSAPGTESHDFRASLGIADPVRFPITARYRYLRNETRDGVDCAVFSIDYEVFRLVSVPRGERIYPTRIAGMSSQTYWWDRANRRPVYYEETFDFLFTFTTGDVFEFKGDADGRLVEASPLDRSQVAGEIREALDAQQVPGVTVAPTDKGVTITLENVNFPPNSDALLPAEQDKLRRIAAILRAYADRDILVEGFTARAPGYTEEDYQALSEKRANAAADFLLSTGAVAADRMTARGRGAASPIGDNSVEEGRMKNRRVEITILEN